MDLTLANVGKLIALSLSFFICDTRTNTIIKLRCQGKNLVQALGLTRLTLATMSFILLSPKTFLQTSPCLIFVAARQRRGHLEMEDKVNYKLPIKWNKRAKAQSEQTHLPLSEPAAHSTKGWESKIKVQTTPSISMSWVSPFRHNSGSWTSPVNYSRYYKYIAK